MSSLWLALPLTFFTVLVAPLWIWLHYSSRKKQQLTLTRSEAQQLQRLLLSAEAMQERIAALEAILDNEHAGWRT